VAADLFDRGVQVQKINQESPIAFQDSSEGKGGMLVRLEEVVWSPATDHGLTSSRARVKLQEGILQVLINLHNGRLVAASVAIVGGTEYGDHVPILAPIVTFHNQLMCSGDQRQSIVVIECFRDVLSECVASTSGTNSPSTAVVRITPE